MRGGAAKCQSAVPSGAAAADLELLTLVLHGLACAKDPFAELAVRLAVDLHGMFVLHNVAGGGIDHYLPTWAISRPAFHRIDHLGAVRQTAVELFDGVEDGVHSVPPRRRHEIRKGVLAVSLVPLFVEGLILRRIEVD